MILSHLDLQKSVKEKRIAFDPPLENKQFGEASVDLRLGFRLVESREGSTIAFQPAE